MNSTPATANVFKHVSYPRRSIHAAQQVMKFNLVVLYIVTRNPNDILLDGLAQRHVPKKAETLGSGNPVDNGYEAEVTETANELRIKRLH